MEIKALDQNGEEHWVKGGEGLSLMEAVRNAGLPIAAECGGVAACATCHVYVDLEWMAYLEVPSEDETLMLEFAREPRENSRLSCQVALRSALDGICITLAPGTA